MLVIFFLCLAIITTNLYPILDGRTAPIVLDTRYTFSNFEWAYGHVSFNQGFDVPSTGTVILRLDGTSPIYDDINLSDGGTLILQKDITLERDVTITGSGFIDANNNNIDFHDLTFYGNHVRLSSSVHFRGRFHARMGFADGGRLDMTNASFVIFEDCQVGIRGNSFITSSSSPSALNFKNCYVTTGINPVIEFFQPKTLFVGAFNRLGIGNELIIHQQLLVNNQSQLFIESNSCLTVENLSIQFDQAKLVLNNSILDFVSTATDDILIGDFSSVQQGSIVINGQSILRSSSNNKIKLAETARLELSSGARLTIDSSTHFTLL
jgi:hypothetical protein